MYVVSLIYRGALRRRMRRLVRSRVFNKVRTATLNLDLPLAIGDPLLASACCKSEAPNASILLDLTMHHAGKDDEMGGFGLLCKEL